mgnify:CR=1 FL=1
MHIGGKRFTKPEFETDDNHSYFISRLFVHEGFLKEETKRSQKGADKRSVKDDKLWGVEMLLVFY